LVGALAAVGCAAATPLGAQPLPTVASINLCADQHVLALADAEQILTVSWLAADPEESLFAAEARRHTLNYGTAEELLRSAPDVVIAGTYTSPFTRTMLRRLGFTVVELEAEASSGDGGYWAASAAAAGGSDRCSGGTSGDGRRSCVACS
jgi:iron complex transport system substrate-binding protein